MDAPNEMIEVGLDAKSNQTTIVVGNDRGSVQCVIVVKSNLLKPKPAANPFQSLRSTLSNTSAAPTTRRRSMRSDLLRPVSPMPQRSSVFEGRRGERDQPPTNRGRDFNRDSGTLMSRVSSHGHYKQRSTNFRMGSESSMQRTCLQPMSENKIYTYRNTTYSRRVKAAKPNRSKLQGIDSVVMIADV